MNAQEALASLSAGGASPLVSGWLCLEFANTVDNYTLKAPYDFLKGYAELRAFCTRTGACSDAQARSLGKRAAAHPEEATSALAQAKELRLLTYQIFSALAHASRPEPALLAELNRRLTGALSRSVILSSPEGFQWGWREDNDALRLPLWIVVRSAAELLTSPHLTRLRQCAGHNCTWLFLDRSKNRSRRWCEMQVCGNRAKSRRHYAKARDSSPGI